MSRGRPTGGLVDCLERHATRGGDQRIRFLHLQQVEEHTYADLWRDSCAEAAALDRHGVGAGTRVALPMATRWETLVAIIALFRLGATLVPIVYQPRMRAGKPQTRSALSALRVGRASHLLTTKEELDTWQQLLASEERSLVTVAIGDTRDRSGGRHDFDVSGAARDNAGDPNPADDRSGPAILQFSSGSTSEPKGIFLTEDNLLACVDGILERFAVQPEDRFFSWLPFFHDMGLIGFLFTPLRIGADFTLWPSNQFIRQPLGWVEGLSRHRATITCGPQFAYNLCLEKSQLGGGPGSKLDLSPLRLALNGSEPVHFDSCRRFQEHFAPAGLRPHVVLACYGLAENCLAVTLRIPETPMTHRHFQRQALAEGRAEISTEPSAGTLTLTATGYPITGTEVRCCAPDGHPAEPSHIGEIHFRGTAATRAFATRNGELRPSSTDGWVATGDLGIEIDGELYIVGRVKELFKRGGRTYVPNDIEISLLALPEIEAGGIAAVAVPHPHTGQEELVLFVELPPRQSPGDLPDRLRLRVLRDYQIPVQDVIPVLRHGLPKTTSGKIQRLALRRAFSQGNLADLVRLHPLADRPGA